MSLGNDDQPITLNDLNNKKSYSFLKDALTNNSKEQPFIELTTLTH